MCSARTTLAGRAPCPASPSHTHAVGTLRAMGKECAAPRCSTPTASGRLPPPPLQIHLPIEPPLRRAFLLRGSRVRILRTSKTEYPGARLKRKGLPVEVGGSNTPWRRVSKSGEGIERCSLSTRLNDCHEKPANSVTTVKALVSTAATHWSAYGSASRKSNPIDPF